MYLAMTKKIVEPLSTSDFKDYFANVPDLKNHMAGIKALDEIPKTLKLKSFIIVNTSVREQKLGHWIVIGRPQKDIVELFNSLGCDSIAPIKPYLKFPFKSEIVYNNSPVQLATSSSCGLYCIYFAVLRYFNLDCSFEEIIEDIFNSDINKNEHRVHQFCHHLLNLTQPHDLFSLNLLL